ncbi:hypothetical protein D9V84_04205 [Bacteroidetes/Chlorobi group bacterium Naka2016]|nr:MAG: hypothetical protein D9V84_04205 [Bacteroidetes/Chlorobi group bacterium Naka2016]
MLLVIAKALPVIDDWKQGRAVVSALGVDAFQWVGLGKWQSIFGGGFCGNCYNTFDANFIFPLLLLKVCICLLHF